MTRANTQIKLKVLMVIIYKTFQQCSLTSALTAETFSSTITLFEARLH